MTAPGQTRAGGEKRGNNIDRANRKVWLLIEFGNGEYVRCVHCGDVLTYDTLEADRIVPGGSYRRDNVQPACRKCNASRSNNPEWMSPIERRRHDTVMAFQRTVAMFDLDAASECALDHVPSWCRS